MTNKQAKAQSGPAPRQQMSGPVPRQQMSRPKLIQLIHVAKKQIALSDDNYRSLIAQTKKSASSCTDLNLFQLGELYKLLKAAGFSPTKTIADRTPKKRRNRQAPTLNAPYEMATPQQLYYIRGLWSLSSRTKDEDSLNKMCVRCTRIDRIEWLDIDSASKLILALRSIARGQGYDPDSLPKKTPTP